MSNDRAKEPGLSKTTTEEVNDVGYDPIRERIAALRRDLAEAGEQQYRTIEFLRERIGAQLGATVEEIRGRVANIIEGVDVKSRRRAKLLISAKRNPSTADLIIDNHKISNANL